MILADDSGTLIHATIKKAQISRNERHIKVGDWRTIENFQLIKATGKYRSTKHSYKIALTNLSEIHRCQSVSDDMYLDLAKFRDVLDEHLTTNILIDIIGQVVNVGELKTIDVNNKTTKKLEFELRDTNDERLPCTLWEEFAENVFKACENAGDKAIILLIRFAKINTFRGERQLTNAYGLNTQVFVNPNIQAAVEFRQELPNDGLSLIIQETNANDNAIIRKKEYFHQFPRKTVSELLDTFEVGKCKILCTISAIDTDWSWYYFSCKKCSKTAYKVPKKENEVMKLNKQPVFWCQNCNEETNKVLPRYKLHVCVMDQTGDTKFMLFDTSAVEILSVSASELLAGEFNEIEDPTNVPVPLKALCGKTFQFLVNIEKDNIEGGNDVYKVSKIWSGTEMIKIDSESYSESHIEHSNNVSVDQETLTLTNSSDHDNEKSTGNSTPSKRSKEAVGDLADQNSTTKKPCMSLVQSEKLDEKSNEDGD